MSISVMILELMGMLRYIRLICTGEKTLCCVIPLLYCFQVYDGKLYLSSWSTSGKFSRAELDGSRLEDLVLYEMGGEQNVLDVVTPMEMAVTKEYLYLYGYSYAASGQWITRIPLRAMTDRRRSFLRRVADANRVYTGILCDPISSKGRLTGGDSSSLLRRAENSVAGPGPNGPGPADCFPIYSA